MTKFQEEMNSYTLISAPAVLGSTIPLTVPSAQPGTLQPPMVLLDFPPLAYFLNNLLVAFNDLRLCCPVAIAQDVTACLEKALSQVGLSLLLGLWNWVWRERMDCLWVFLFFANDGRQQIPASPLISGGQDNPGFPPG